MPIASTCPKCFRQVTIPEGAAPSARARCPHCREEYVVQEALGFVPPALEILDSDAVADWSPHPAHSPGESLSISAPFGSVDEAFGADTTSGDSSSNVADAFVSESTASVEAEPVAPVFEEAAEPVFEDAISAAEVSELDAAQAAGLNESDAVVSYAIMNDASEDEDTLPAMEAGSLAPGSQLSDLESAPRGFGEALSADAAEDFTRTREAPPDDAEPEWLLEPETERAASTPDGAFAAPAFSSTPRVRRKEKSMIKELAKILVANLIAFPFFYAVLIWGFKTDPFQLAQYLPPDIVPPPLRAKTPDSDPTKLAQRHTADRPATNAPPAPSESPTPSEMPAPGGPSQGDAPSGATPSHDESTPLKPSDPDYLALDPVPAPDDATADRPQTGTKQTPSSPANSPVEWAPGQDQLSTELIPPTATASEPSTPSVPSVPSVPEIPSLPGSTAEPPPTSDPPAASSSTDPTDSSKPSRSSEPTESSEPAAPNTNILAPKTNSGELLPADPFTPGDSGFPPPPDPIAPPAEPAEPIGPKAKTRYSAADVNQAMIAAGEAARAAPALPENPSIQEFAKLRPYYLALAKLAEKVTLMDADPADLLASRMGSAAQVESQAKGKLSMRNLGRLASFWFASQKRTDNGIVLAGEVESVEPQGKLFRMQLKLPESGPVNVLSAEKPDVVPGDRALVLGLIVENPTENLHDYQGSDQKVVWAGVVVHARP